MNGPTNVINGTPWRKKTAAVLVEAWKLSTFERHLKEAGYAYEGPIQLNPEFFILNVAYDWAHELEPVIRAAQAECERAKAN